MTESPQVQGELWLGPSTQRTEAESKAFNIEGPPLRDLRTLIKGQVTLRSGGGAFLLYDG